jgi:acyl-CoA synthetase (NDP forming)
MSTWTLGAVAMLDKLVRPACIAVVGASDNFRSMAGLSLVNLRQHGYKGVVYPVNPRHTELLGYRCYPSLRDLPTVPDTAIIQVPARAVPATLHDCIDVGIPTATVLSSGFGEGDRDDEARARTEEVRRIADSGKIRILGPNCIGLVDVSNQIVQRAAAFLPEVLHQGPVSIIAQSGGASLILLNRAQQRGVGLNLILTTGNELDVDMTDLFEYAVGRRETKVVCLVVETIRRGARFLDVARDARARGIELLAMKVGTSEEGSRAVSAHTGALAGTDEAYDAAFRSVGIVRVDHYDSLSEAALILERLGRRPGRRLGVVSISGGEAAWISDKCADVGLELPPLSEPTREALEGKLRFGALRNPLDLTGQLFSGDAELGVTALRAVAADPVLDLLLVAITSLGPEVASWLGPMISQASRETRKPIMVVWWTAGSRTLQAHHLLEEQGLIVFESSYRALAAIAAASGIPMRPYTRNRHPRASAAPSEHRILTGTLAEAWFGTGIPMAPSALVSTIDDAKAAASDFGFPVAMKLMLPGVAHKTEMRAVRLDIATTDQLERNWHDLVSLVPGLERPRIQLQPMLKGIEVLVGGRRDDVFGPLVTVAAGGILAELVQDIACELAPVTAEQARCIIKQLKTAPLLFGYRGSAACDVDALAKTIAAFSARFAESDALAAELNPVLVGELGHGAIAVDALVEV